MIKLNIFPNFGLALKEALLRQKRSAAWLSRITGKDKGQISKYMSGTNIPRGLTLIQLSEPLDVEFARLDTGEWQLIEKTVRTDISKEPEVKYIAKDYNTEKKKLLAFFKAVDSYRNLFEESDSKSSLTENEKLLQIEMIEGKLRSMLE